MTIDGHLAVRPARPRDTRAIAEIWYSGWRDGHLGNVSDDLVAARPEGSFEPRAAERVGDTTVALVDGAVAGFVMIAGDEVDQVYVARRHRGTDVAATLLAEAEGMVAANGYQHAWLAVVPGNARARRFYERQGWTDDGVFEHSAPSATGTIPVVAHRYAKQVHASP